MNFMNYCLTASPYKLKINFNLVTHYININEKIVCNRKFKNFKQSRYKSTTDINDVTCKNCLKKLGM